MREMKDSGIEWIGSIPANWKSIQIKHLFSILSGATPTPDTDNWDGDVIWITPADYKTKDKYVSCGKRNISQQGFNSCSTSMIPKGSIIFSKRAPIGTVAINQEELCTNQGCLSCVSKADTYNDYFYYVMSIGTEHFELLGSGTTFKEISANSFSNCKLPCPDKAEQEKIAVLLDEKCAEFNTLISDIQSQIETLEEYKRSVITEAVTKGLEPDAEMKDSGYRWCPVIPKHWHKIPSKYLFRSSDIRKYPNDVQLTASQRHGIISQSEYMERENAKIVLANQGIENWKHVEPNDFIISLRSFQGGLELSEVTGCITWHYIVLRATKPVVHRYYKWLFKSQTYIKALQGTCNFIRDGQDLRYSNFVQVPIFQPPMEEQQQIADYLDMKCAEIDNIISEKEQQIEAIEEYKKSLIFEYVTGKKEVQA